MADAEKKDSNTISGCAILIFTTVIIFMIAIALSDHKSGASQSTASYATEKSIEVKAAAIDKVYEGNANFEVYTNRNRYLFIMLSTKSGYDKERIAEIAYKTKMIFFNEKGLDFSMQEMLELLNNGMTDNSIIKLEEVAAFMATTVTRK
jgi:hypothetical protein